MSPGTSFPVFTGNSFGGAGLWRKLFHPYPLAVFVGLPRPSGQGPPRRMAPPASYGISNLVCARLGITVCSCLRDTACSDLAPAAAVQTASICRPEGRGESHFSNLIAGGGHLIAAGGADFTLPKSEVGALVSEKQPQRWNPLGYSLTLPSLP